MTVPPLEPQDRPVSLAKVARLTGLNERSLRHWCATGRLTDWQPSGASGHRYVTARALEAFGLPAGMVAAVAAFAASGASGSPSAGTGD